MIEETGTESRDKVIFNPDADAGIDNIPLQTIDFNIDIDMVTQNSKCRLSNP